jgi:glycosyltransferase involved in cell wall biosynthesis
LIQKITVVTPSYNQGIYLEDAILSVLGQAYKNLEYFVFDGGSSDNSFSIIRHFEQQITKWQSCKDGGQAAALNAAFKKSTGDIFCWLNSDDILLPGALKFVASHLSIDSPAIGFGSCIHFKQGENSVKAWGSNPSESFKRFKLNQSAIIIQPAMFFTRSAFELVGPFDEKLTYTFDWEWLIRAQDLHVRFIPWEKPLAMYRIHETHKSSNGGKARQSEVEYVYRKANPKYADLYKALSNRENMNASFAGRLRKKWASLVNGSNMSFYKQLLAENPSFYAQFTEEDVQLVVGML